MERAAQRADDGLWRLPPTVLPIAGVWRAEIEILVSDFDRITLAGPIVLKP
jgi:hypothetical protein